jgi:hypothetical protein
LGISISTCQNCHKKPPFVAASGTCPGAALVVNRDNFEAFVLG